MGSGGDGTVLVTGATGFVGQHYVRFAASRYAKVIGLSRREMAATEGVVWKRVENLNDRVGLRRALEGVDTVVHLAGRVHLGERKGRDSWRLYQQVNVEGTAALLEEARAAGVRRFAYTSTVKVMGPGADNPLKEDAPARPADAYGTTKLEAETLVRFAASGGFRTVVLRLPLVYGPGVKANMLRLFAWVDRGLPLPFGSIENLRSFLYVGNLTYAIETALRVADRGNIYFVSDGEDVSTNGLIRAIGRSLGKEPRLVRFPVRILKTVAHIGDGLARVAPFPLTSGVLTRLAESLTVDISRFRHEANYAPPFSMADGLKATADWFCSREEKAW